MNDSLKGRVQKVNKESIFMQIVEGVYIRRSIREIINSKLEWIQSPIHLVRTEVDKE